MNCNRWPAITLSLLLLLLLLVCLRLRRWNLLVTSSISWRRRSSTIWRCFSSRSACCLRLRAIVLQTTKTKLLLVGLLLLLLTTTTTTTILSSVNWRHAFYETLMTKCTKHIKDFFEYVPYIFTLYLLTYLLTTTTTAAAAADYCNSYYDKYTRRLLQAQHLLEVKWYPYRHRREVSRCSRWVRCCMSSVSAALTVRNASICSFCRRRKRWLFDIVVNERQHYNLSTPCLRKKCNPFHFCNTFLIHQPI